MSRRSSNRITSLIKMLLKCGYLRDGVAGVWGGEGEAVSAGWGEREVFEFSEGVRGPSAADRL